MPPLRRNSSMDRDSLKLWYVRSYCLVCRQGDNSLFPYLFACSQWSIRRIVFSAHRSLCSRDLEAERSTILQL